MRLALAVLAVCLLAGNARADGIDIGAWVMQLPTWWGPGAILGFVLVSLLIDYALNFLVIGWLAARWSGEPRRKVARDLVAYTLWAQLADRAAAVLGLITMAAMDPWLSKQSEGYFVMPLLVSKVAWSVVTIALLVLRFARKRWGLARGRSLVLGIAGGVLTNPGLGMLAAGWLLSRSSAS